MQQPALLPGGSKVKILVVDDHPNTAKTLARAISQLGPELSVVSATSGAEALAQVKDGAADILITDMIMPGMTGLELIEKLNHHPSGRPTFSFLMTAYDVPGLNLTAKRLKVKEVLVKPVLPERVCQIIKRALADMNQAEPASKEPASQKRSFTILIADDRPDNLTLLSRYLESEGYAYGVARDGLETLEKIRNELPDLVLLDVNMPHKDGFAVLEEIRSDPATQHIPVIILTAARLDPAEIQFGLNLGADDYVTKPFDRRELLARIRTKLRVKEAEDVIRRRNRELNLLPEIGRELSAGLSIEDLSTILLKHTVETLGAMYGHIVILNSTGNYQKTYHLASSLPASEFVFQQELLQIIRDTQQGFIIEDTHQDSRWQAASNDPTGSAVVVPLQGRFNLLGLLMLANEQTRYFTLDHLLLLQAIASQASIAVEHAQLYDAVLQERQRLAAVLQSAAEAILVFDSEGRLSLLNPAGQKLFTDYEAKLGQCLETGTGHDSLQYLLEQTRHSSVSCTGEVVWPDKRVFSALITPVQEGGIVAVLHDVTHFKELERVKDEFIATASHDLRNPITSVKGFSQLIRQAGSLNENQAEFAKRIEYAAEHMTELVENMLDLAKIDLGAGLKHEIFDVYPLLRQLEHEFKLQAEANGQVLTLEETGVNTRVSGDERKVRQAIRNLIGNAIKYSADGGAITLSLDRDASVLNVQVKDTGRGIPPADVPHIFERFYRVRNNGQNEVEGDGLGLAIVKSIAEEHGGRVSVKSQLGQGSCFTFTLPITPDLDPSVVPVNARKKVQKEG